MPDTTLTSAELDELERLAKAATPGPWDTDEPHIVYAGNGENLGESIRYLANTDNLDTPYAQAKLDAAFIASANPATILRLLSLARAGLEAGKAEESMRERAAKSLEALIDKLYGEPGLQAHHERQALLRGAIAIRALPLTTGGDKP